jgi:hypothetical protein
MGGSFSMDRAKPAANLWNAQETTAQGKAAR